MQDRGCALLLLLLAAVTLQAVVAAPIVPSDGDETAVKDVSGDSTGDGEEANGKLPTKDDEAVDEEDSKADSKSKKTKKGKKSEPTVKSFEPNLGGLNGWYPHEQDRSWMNAMLKFQDKLGAKAVKDPRYEDAFVRQAHPNYVQLYHDRHQAKPEFMAEAMHKKQQYDQQIKDEKRRSKMLDHKIFEQFKPTDDAIKLRSKYQTEVTPEDKLAFSKEPPKDLAMNAAGADADEDDDSKSDSKSDSESKSDSKSGSDSKSDSKSGSDGKSESKSGSDSKSD